MKFEHASVRQQNFISLDLKKESYFCRYFSRKGNNQLFFTVLKKWWTRIHVWNWVQRFKHIYSAVWILEREYTGIKFDLGTIEVHKTSVKLGTGTPSADKTLHASCLSGDCRVMSPPKPRPLCRGKPSACTGAASGGLVRFYYTLRRGLQL